MDFSVKIRTCSGMEDFLLQEDKIGCLERDIIEKYDPRITDIVCLLLEEEFTSEGVNTPQDLLEYEEPTILQTERF